MEIKFTGCKSLRRADAGSDHYLLLGKIKMKLTTKGFETENPSKRNVKDEYLIKLQNSLNALLDH